MTLRPNVWVEILLVLFISSLFSVSRAQTVESISDQRQSLLIQRDDAMRYFDAKDAHCRRQFAVTGCLSDVNRERLARLSVIKKAENQLKDRERQERALEQRQQLVDRADAHEKQVNEVLNATSSERKTSPTPINRLSDSPAFQGRINNGEVATEPKGKITAAQQRENRAAYESKQQEANRKREAREKRVKESKPAVQRLPGAP
jgi:hypothetical protein